MATITIGGEKIEIAPLSFYQIEKAWPFFNQATDVVGNPIAATSFYLGFIACVLEDDRPEFKDIIAIKKRMRASEIAGIAATVSAILMENEMIAKPGEGDPAETPPAGALSTATASDSSAS